jgi:hypothetical protein
MPTISKVGRPGGSQFGVTRGTAAPIAAPMPMARPAAPAPAPMPGRGPGGRDPRTGTMRFKKGGPVKKGSKK